MVITKESRVLVVSKLFSVSILLLLSLILCLNIVSSQGITAKIGNAKMVLYPELKGKELLIERTILVINDNTVPVNISLEPSIEFKDIIIVNDKNFILQPGERKNASFTIRLTKTGDYSGNLNVYFSKLGETGGVALASKIILHVKGDSSWTSIFDNNVILVFGLSSLILIIVLVFLVWLIKKKSGKIKDKRVKARNE